MTQEQDSPFVDDKNKPTPAILAIASLLAGLTDELKQPGNNPAPGAIGKGTSSPELEVLIIQVRGQVDELLKRIQGLLKERQSARLARIRPELFTTSTCISSALMRTYCYF